MSLVMNALEMLLATWHLFSSFPCASVFPFLWNTEESSEWWRHIRNCINFVIYNKVIYIHTHICVLTINIYLFCFIFHFHHADFYIYFQILFYQVSSCPLKFKCQCICPGLLAEPASWEIEHEFISKSYLSELTLQPAWIRKKDLSWMNSVENQRLTSTKRARFTKNKMLSIL